MTKKYWIIKGTNLSSEKKEELKPARRQLNKDAGTMEVDDLDTKAHPSNLWAYRISKGPDHPSHQYQR